jgi:predicted phosphate transport protein (TIGR00153 family)
MRISFLPKEKSFYRLLEKLALQAEEAVKVFQALLESWRPHHPDLQTLKDIEHRCDQLVHEIMIKLNKTFVTPFDREDIHRLTKRIDDLADIAQAVSERLQLFEIQHVTKDLQEMTAVLGKAVGLVLSAIFKLSTPKQTKNILQCCVEINVLESEGDRIFERALGALFHEAKDPLEVIKWKEIYDSVELAIDRCEDIADILWGIVVKYG